MDKKSELRHLLKNISPRLNDGDYVFIKTQDLSGLILKKILFLFREDEAITLVLEKTYADELKLSYSYIAAWISLEVESSLEAVGLTAAFSSALSKKSISCNVVAAYYHDHIFVAKNDAEKAIQVLKNLSEMY